MAEKNTALQKMRSIMFKRSKKKEPRQKWKKTATTTLEKARRKGTLATKKNHSKLCKSHHGNLQNIHRLFLSDTHTHILKWQKWHEAIKKNTILLITITVIKCKLKMVFWNVINNNVSCLEWRRRIWNGLTIGCRGKKTRRLQNNKTKNDYRTTSDYTILKLMQNTLMKLIKIRKKEKKRGRSTTTTIAAQLI